MIEVKNLTKSYGKFVAVKNISFEIQRGSIVGFVGKNGAGKTTTVRCMLDFLKPTAGSVKINGLDASSDSERIKSFLGYMPSDPMFYPNCAYSALFPFCRLFYSGGECKYIYRSRDFKLG